MHEEVQVSLGPRVTCPLSTELPSFWGEEATDGAKALPSQVHSHHTPHTVPKIKEITAPSHGNAHVPFLHDNLSALNSSTSRKKSILEYRSRTEGMRERRDVFMPHFSIEVATVPI